MGHISINSTALLVGIALVTLAGMPPKTHATPVSGRTVGAEAIRLLQPQQSVLPDHSGPATNAAATQAAEAAPSARLIQVKVLIQDDRGAAPMVGEEGNHPEVMPDFRPGAGTTQVQPEESPRPAATISPRPTATKGSNTGTNRSLIWIKPEEPLSRECPDYQKPVCMRGEKITYAKSQWGCEKPVCRPVKPPCPKYAPPQCGAGEEVVFVKGRDGCSMPACRTVNARFREEESQGWASGSPGGGDASQTEKGSAPWGRAAPQEEEVPAAWGQAARESEGCHKQGCATEPTIPEPASSDAAPLEGQAIAEPASSSDPEPPEGQVVAEPASSDPASELPPAAESATASPGIQAQTGGPPGLSQLLSLFSSLGLYHSP